MQTKETRFAVSSGDKADGSKFTPSFKHRIPGLDELRGIAILLVLFRHSILTWWTPEGDFAGALGVNIFLIISGYLICTILQNTRQNPNFFRAFYIRRVFRIWPLFFAITLAGVVAGLCWHRPVLHALPYYLTFTMNVAVEKTAHAASVGDLETWLIPFTSPMWTLAIEEQFYLCLPLLVFALAPKRLPYVVAFVCLVSAISSSLCLKWSSEMNPILFYPNFKNTVLRLHYLGFGVLLATNRRLAAVVFFAWLAASIAFLHRAGIVEILIAGMIVWIIDRTIQRRPFFRNRLLAWLGFLCYGLYLIHWPVVRLLEHIFPPNFESSIPLATTAFGLFMIISIAAANYSFKYFENPIQKMRTRFEGKSH